MVFVCLILSSCATYRGGRLPSTDIGNFQNAQEQEGLKVAVKFYEPYESKQLFGKKGVKCIAKKYQPAYILIDNRSRQTYEFKKRQLSKASSPAQEVADDCRFKTGGRAAGYGVAGLFCWPLLIPAIVDGTGSARANNRMEEDLMFKEIKDERIPPNGLLNGIIFLERMKDGEELDVRLRNINGEEIKLFSFYK